MSISEAFLSSPEKDGTSYRAVLALPYASRLFTAGLLARLCYGLLPIPVLLALREGTGSFAIAGIALALRGLLQAFLGPPRARQVERNRAVLIFLAAGFALSLIVLAAACAIGISALPACGLALLTGLFPPPVGPLMRARWSQIAHGAEQRQRALALDTATESSVFALGPVLGGLLVDVSSASIVLVGCAALVLVAFSLLTTVFRSVARTAPAKSSPGSRPRSPLRAKGLPPLLILVGAIAVGLSVSEVAVVAAWGPLTGGILTAMIPVGGVLGGLFYGRRQWRGSLNTRPLILTGSSVPCYALLALAYIPSVAGVGLFLAGICADTMLVTTYQLADVLFSAEILTVAGAWLNTIYNLGSSMGAAIGGVSVGRLEPLELFSAVAGLIALCSVISAILTPRRQTPAVSTKLQTEVDSQRPT